MEKAMMYGQNNNNLLESMQRGVLMINYRLEFKEFPKITFAHTAILPYHSINFQENDKSVELSYIEKGACDLWVNGAHHILEENTLLLLVKKNKISLKANSEHIHHTVNLYGEYDFNSKNGIFLPLSIRITPRTEYLRVKLKEVITEFQLHDTASQWKATAMSLEILSEISRIYEFGISNKENLFSPSEYLLSNSIKRYTAENLNRNILLTEIGEVLSKTPNYLNAVFKKVNGITIKQYINKEKINTVCLLMQNYGLSLKEAGENVGITDQNYLSRLFKKTMGISAQKYFTQYGKEIVSR